MRLKNSNHFQKDVRTQCLVNLYIKRTIKSNRIRAGNSCNVDIEISA